jgi:hypothetical protein
MSYLRSKQNIKLIRESINRQKGKNVYSAVGRSGVENEKVLSEFTISQMIKNAKYEVRGPVSDLADKMIEQHLLPFKKIVRLNLGNPQALGQSPFTFIREVSHFYLFRILIKLGFKLCTVTGPS